MMKSTRGRLCGTRPHYHSSERVYALVLRGKEVPEMTLQVLVKQGEDGYFVAHCPSLKSCRSQGKTREEALRNIEEAISLYLEAPPNGTHPR
jgi:predicted RNase H-like HicB family nuclease